MKVRIAVAVVTLALGGALAANAQVQPPQERINTALARARQVGIPAALLESKIAEGRAKGVPLDRIAAAIERRQASLERANQAMRGQTDAAASLAVGADAIESGVSEAVLKAVADNSPRDRRNVAIAALTELVHQGQSPEAALERVRDALKRGPDALTNLPAEGSQPRFRVLERQGNGERPGEPRPGQQGQGNQGTRGTRGHGRQGQGQGQGNSGRRAGAEPGPPAGVPAPGNHRSQASQTTVDKAADEAMARATDVAAGVESRERVPSDLYASDVGARVLLSPLSSTLYRMRFPCSSRICSDCWKCSAPGVFGGTSASRMYRRRACR